MIKEEIGMPKFTQIPTDTFESLQINAGIIATAFDPATGTLDADNIIGATTGGVNFRDSVDYIDFGDDIDNCPKNTLELKKINGRTVTMGGTLVTIKTAIGQKLAGAADVAGTKITPRDILKSSDFSDLWWIGDYSDVNEDSGNTVTAGFCAIKLINALNTGGFQLQSSDRGKGQFAFEFTGHYSMADISKVPYEVYIKEGVSA